MNNEINHSELISFELNLDVFNSGDQLEKLIQYLKRNNFNQESLDVSFIKSISKNQNDLIHFLINNGSDPATSNSKCTLIVSELRGDNLNILKLLIKNGYHTNHDDIILKSAQSNNIKILSYLVENGHHTEFLNNKNQILLNLLSNKNFKPLIFLLNKIITDIDFSTSETKWIVSEIIEKLPSRLKSKILWEMI